MFLETEGNQDEGQQHCLAVEGQRLLKKEKFCQGTVTVNVCMTEKTWLLRSRDGPDRLSDKLSGRGASVATLI